LKKKTKESNSLLRTRHLPWERQSQRAWLLSSRAIDAGGGFAYTVSSVAAVFPALFLNDSAK